MSAEKCLSPKCPLCPLSAPSFVQADQCSALALQELNTALQREPQGTEREPQGTDTFRCME